MGAETVTRRFELLTQGLKIVDLAVERQPATAVLTRHRLLTAGEIDDRQAAMAEAHTGRTVIARLVRAAMGQGIRHATQQAIGNLTDAA